MRQFPATPELCPPSRRSLLVGPVASMVTVSATVAAPASDAGLMVDYAEWRALCARDADDFTNKDFRRQDELTRRMAFATPHTAAGVATLMAFACNVAQDYYEWENPDHPATIAFQSLRLAATRVPDLADQAQQAAELLHEMMRWCAEKTMSTPWGRPVCRPDPTLLE